MSDPFAKTRYRVSQRWRICDAPPEIEDVLVILNVEEHPTQGIICCVRYDFVPALQSSPYGSVGYGGFWITQAALDRSVSEFVGEKGPPPRDHSFCKDFCLRPMHWERWRIVGHDKSVAEHARESVEEIDAERARLASRQELPPPPESRGLWSLIADDDAQGFRERLALRPSVVRSILPYDESDEHCCSDEEYEECFPSCSPPSVGALALPRRCSKRAQTSAKETPAGIRHCTSLAVRP